MGHIHVSWCEPCKVRRVVAVGSKQWVQFDDMNGPEPIRVTDSGVAAAAPSNYAEHLNFRTGDTSIPRVASKEPLKEQASSAHVAPQLEASLTHAPAQVSHFAECVREGRPSPLSPAEAGVGVVLVLEAAERSIASGGAKEAVQAPSGTALRNLSALPV